MINVSANRCCFTGCVVMKPKFNIKGNITGKYCKLHKTSDMIDVITKKCKYSGCNIIPGYGYKEKSPEYCITHKLKDMISLSHKYICKFTECKSISVIYGYLGKFPEYCIKHKKNDMINLKSQICKFKDCKQTSRNFDYPHGKGQFCGLHKLNGMINVKIPRCNYETCTKQIYYGEPGKKPSRCAEHREKGMIRRSNKKCIICKIPAIYGKNFIPTHCEEHKELDESNLVEKKCINCGLLFILDKDGKCEYCNPEIFKIVTLAKQTAVLNYLDNHELIGDSTDKTIDGGICGKERPDRIYDFDDKIIILECDENQHKYRNCICEQTRMINIASSFGGIPTYFIRFNPDDYITESIYKIPERINSRYKNLVDLLTSIKHNKIKLPTALVSAIYMYYDDWISMAEEEWKIITPYEKVSSVLSHV
jgi:hypothetical protein